MYNLSRNELKFVLKNFRSIKNFVSFFEDKWLFDLQSDKKAPINVDLSPYSSNRMVTGFLISIRKEENQFKADMLVGGNYREFDIGDECMMNFKKARKQILKDKDNCSLSVKEIINYKFAQNKPFLIKVEDNVITTIKPLDISFYNSCMDMWLRVSCNS